MKQLVKITAVALVAIFVMTSCNKDQRCINWLDGVWDVTEFTTTDSSGTTTDVFATSQALGLTTTGTFTFEKYKMKDEDNGKADLTINTKGQIFGQTVDETQTENFTYSIMDDCETIRLTDDSGTTDDADILEASKKKMVIEYTDEDGTVNNLTIEKQEK